MLQPLLSSLDWNPKYLKCNFYTWLYTCLHLTKMFISKKQIQISRNLLDAHVSRRHRARKYWNSNRSQSVSIGPPPTNALLVITLNSTTKLTAHCWKDCKCSQRKAMCIVVHWMTGELDSDLACKQKGPTGPIFQAKKATRADFLVQGELFNHILHFSYPPCQGPWYQW